MRDQILSLLQQALPEHEVPSDLADDDNYVDALGLDSLDMLSVATALEKAFAIRIEDVEWTQLSSLSQVLALVGARTVAAQPQTAAA